MINTFIINFLIFICFFISISLTSSFSDNEKSLLDIINIVSPLKINDLEISDDDIKIISKSKDYNIFELKDKKKLKIYYVGSYGPGHIGGQPQINSFFRCIRDIGTDFKLEVDIEGWYLDTSKTFINRYQINEISKYVIKDIKRYDPDIIYVTDDAAFEYIGIYLSDDYPIIFSGINYPFKGYDFKYKGIINRNNISGVEELVSIDNLYDLFKSARIFPNKWYFINDSTDVSSYISENLKEELFKLGVSYESFDVDDAKAFINVVKDLNNREPGIIVNNVHSLYSYEYSEQLNTLSLSILLVSYNKVHLEFSLNSKLCQYGMAITNGPDYNKTGYLAGKILINMLETGKSIHNIKRLKPEVTINFKRIEGLPYYRGLLNHLDKVDNIISSY